MDGQLMPLFQYLASDVDDYPLGLEPASPLLEYAPGKFVGTTAGGGALSYPGLGTIFAISSTGEFQMIYNTTSSNGPQEPNGLLAVAADGNLYGDTDSGPEHPNGDVYRITPQGDFSNAFVFSTNLEGSEPSGIFPGSDGRLYTATYGGGTDGTGTVAAISTSGDMTVLHNFSATNLNGSSDGWDPQAPLVQGSDGAFYGTTKYGGAYLQGMIFRLALSPPLPASIPVHYVQGSAHAFLLIRSESGALLGYGELLQLIRGDRVISYLTYHFRDGSIDDDTTIFSQRKVFHLISDHHVQHGPFFPKTTDCQLDGAGNVTIRKVKADGKATIETTCLSTSQMGSPVPYCSTPPRAPGLLS